jgi:hypothetical protein
MIPAFNESSVLPPYIGNEPGNRGTMSPYEASMSELVRRFATTEERIAILDGLLSYRHALAQVGILDGFQWIDGSFVENVELSRNRPPQDVDIITFAYRPNAVTSDAAWLDFFRNHQELFHPALTKDRYKCDAYYIDLEKHGNLLVDDTRYWSGLFSHQRSTFLWKGMVRIPLRSDDDQAQAWL